MERSHSSDKTEFYQLLDYKDDVDLHSKLREWEIFYNCHRPHGALKGKTPYEILKLKLANSTLQIKENSLLLLSVSRGSS